MKKVVKKVLLIGISLMLLLQNFCFALETKPIADSVLQNSRRMMKSSMAKSDETFNFWPIIIGIVVVIIIVIAIIVIIKNKKKNKVETNKE